MKNYTKLFIPVMIFFLSNTGGGCAPTIVLSSDAYRPNVDLDMIAFRDKPIYLEGFSNNAQNTSIFYYYSEKQSVRYGGPSIQSYLWYCFEKALRKKEMRVYSEDNPPYKEIPRFGLTFTSWTDEKFIARVKLVKEGKEVFSKIFTVNFTGLKGGSDHLLKQAAYHSIDRIICSIFGDAQFQEAFFNK
jgi:hypothetical protein